MPNVLLDWRGPQLLREMEKASEEALVEFGLRLETAAKSQLRKGHGVVTGTLRRSIHMASPDYDFAGDNVPPAAGTPERGGREARVGREADKIAIETGSGLEYAMAVHQGHGTFDGYHFITGPFEQLKGKFDGILARKAKAHLK